MPDATITVPEHLEMRISRLVDEGEFLSREAAVEALLSTGVTAYKTSGQREQEDERATSGDSDLMGHDDQYVF